MFPLPRADAESSALLKPNIAAGADHEPGSHKVTREISLCFTGRSECEDFDGPDVIIHFSDLEKLEALSLRMPAKHLVPWVVTSVGSLDTLTRLTTLHLEIDELTVAHLCSIRCLGKLQIYRCTTLCVGPLEMCMLQST